MCNTFGPIKTRYGLDKVHEDGNGLRRGLSLLITEPEDIAVLKAIDETVIKKAVENSTSWFKKQLTEEQIRAKYAYLVEETPEHTAEKPCMTMKIKVKCTGSPVPTAIYEKVSDTDVKVSDENILLNKGALVIPNVSTMGVYFMGGDSRFGVSFQAEKIIVIPGTPLDPLADMVLETPLQVVKTAEGGGTKRPAEEEDDDAPKRFKVELEDEDGSGGSAM